MEIWACDNNNYVISVLFLQKMILIVYFHNAMNLIFISKFDEKCLATLLLNVVEICVKGKRGNSYHRKTDGSSTFA